jgi:hypothetical protein
MLLPAPAHAWAIGSQINEAGCHEPITADALRAVRARFDTAPPLTPSRDEDAMIAAVLFSPPADFVDDLAGMALLLGVRDNDLKGINPLSSLDLIQVHGNPETQDEHCIRSADDDGDGGNRAALAACRGFTVVGIAVVALHEEDAARGRIQQAEAPGPTADPQAPLAVIRSMEVGSSKSEVNPLNCSPSKKEPRLTRKSPRSD